jgi:hypothetical protein
MRVLVNMAHSAQRLSCPGFLPIGFLWVLLTAPLFLSACSHDASGKPTVQDPGRRPAVPVTVTTVDQQTVPLQLRAIGVR